MRIFENIDITNREELLEYLKENVPAEKVLASVDGLVIDRKVIEDYISSNIQSNHLTEQAKQYSTEIREKCDPQAFYNLVENKDLLSVLPIIFKIQTQTLQLKQDLILIVQELRTYEQQLNKLVSNTKELLVTHSSYIAFTSKKDRQEFEDACMTDLKFKVDQILRIRQQFETYLELVDNYMTYINKYESSIRLKHNKEVHDFYKNKVPNNPF